MLVAGVLFAAMGVFVKLGAAHFSGAELVFYRSLVGLAVISLIVAHRRLPLATPHWRAHLRRSLVGFAALMLFFHAIVALPLATAITLNYTSPLFLAGLVTVFLRERAGRGLVAALGCGLVGVVLVLHPTVNPRQWLGGLLGLGSGVLAGVAYYNVKQLGALNEPAWRVVFYFTLVCTAGAALWMLPFRFSPVDLDGALILLGLGSTATLAQLAMTRAYSEGRTLAVGSLAYSTVVFASLFGMLLWAEVPTASSWLGIALIVASGIASIRLAPDGQPPSPPGYNPQDIHPARPAP